MKLNQQSKKVVIERTVTKHETMEVISSSVHQISEQKVAKSSSEKQEKVSEILSKQQHHSSQKLVTNSSKSEHHSCQKVVSNTSKSEQEQHVIAKTKSEIPSNSEIEKQIDDFVSSTSEEEAKALLEQISASNSKFSIFYFAYYNNNSRKKNWVHQSMYLCFQKSNKYFSKSGTFMSKSDYRWRYKIFELI